MMYNQKLVASIKANGKILREFKDTVYIPFGSEYSILLKNLNTVRAIVNVYLDGENCVPGGLVINAGQSIDLERWIKNGNLSEGNRFKFIERTGAVEQHRGISLEDGLVRIEYQFERMVNFGLGNMPLVSTSHWDTNNGVMRSSRAGGQSASYSSAILNNVTVSATSFNGHAGVPTSMKYEQTNDANDVGITVPGSKSEQKFQTASWFPTEDVKHNIVLKLLGETEDNKPVYKAVTVKAKPKCVTCGKQNKASAKFCAECGTHLEIFA